MEYNYFIDTLFGVVILFLIILLVWSIKEWLKERKENKRLKKVNRNLKL